MGVMKRLSRRAVIDRRGPLGVAAVVAVVMAGACGHPMLDASERALSETDQRLAPVMLDDASGDQDRGALDGPSGPSLAAGTLATYQAYAFAHSPALRASFERWRAAVAGASAGRALPDPVISYTGFVSSVETRVGPMQHKVGVRQWFPWPTAVTARVDADAQQGVHAQRVFEAHALSLAAEVARAYWALWRIDAEQAIQRRQMQLLDTMRQLVETRVEVGAADVSAVAQLGLRMTRLKNAISTSDERREKAAARLGFAIGARALSAAGISTEPPSAVLPTAPATQMRQALDTHPRVESNLAQAEGARLLAKSARGARAPRMSLGVDWTVIGESQAAVPDSGKDAVAVSAAISVPIWAGGAASRARRQDARSRAYRAEAAHVRDRLYAELELLLTDLRSSQRKIKLCEMEMLPQASIAVASVRSAFEAGRAGVADVLWAYGAALEIEMELVAARHDHAVAWSDLEALVGMPVMEGGADDGE